MIWEELETEICEMNLQSQEIRNDQNKANEIENVNSSAEDNPPPKKMRSFLIGFQTVIVMKIHLNGGKKIQIYIQRSQNWQKSTCQ